MKLLSPFYKIRGALAAWRDADPRQAGRLGTVLKFFAVMLVLTLAARGIAGASMPVVTLTSAAASSITQSSTAAGTIAVRGGTPLLVPEGVLVTEVSAAAGQSLQAGDVIARFDAASLAQALAARQAQVRQLETTAAQLQDPETADRFALQQAQQQLDRAYADAQETWQEGEEAVAEARARRDSAQSALRALQSQPPATPESAEAERQQQIAAAQAELDSAEAALRRKGVVAAVCLAGVIILVLLVSFPIVLGGLNAASAGAPVVDSIVGGLSYALQYLAMCVLLILSLVKSGSWARDVLGG